VQTLVSSTLRTLHTFDFQTSKASRQALRRDQQLVLESRAARGATMLQFNNGRTINIVAGYSGLATSR